MTRRPNLCAVDGLIHGWGGSFTIYPEKASGHHGTCGATLYGATETEEPVDCTRCLVEGVR